VSGVERQTGGLTLGVSAALGGSTVDFGQGLGSLSTETWHGGAYASVSLGKVVFDAAVSMGTGENTMKRNSSLNSQPVKFRNTEWLTQAGVSVAMNAGSLSFTPAVHFLSFGYRPDQFSDAGGGLFETKILANSYVRNAVKAGLQASELLNVRGHAVRLSASAHWLHYLDARRHQTDAVLGGFADSAVTMQSSKVGADSIQFGAAAEIALTAGSEHHHADGAVMAHGLPGIGQLHEGARAEHIARFGAVDRDPRHRVAAFEQHIAHQ
jgi:hypothetical protein